MTPIDDTGRDLSRLTQATLTSALAYWERICGDRAMPARGDLDPVEIPRLLPFVMLVDVLTEPLDFKFRLIGTEVQAIIARDLPGKRFSAVPHMAPGNKLWSEYESVVANRRPLTSGVDYVGTDRRVRAIRHCVMPLSTDGKAVNMLFVAVEIERG